MIPIIYFKIYAMLNVNENDLHLTKYLSIMRSEAVRFAVLDVVAQGEWSE